MLMVCHHLDQAHPRGPRLRREPHPQGDDRRRGHPARPRRALDDVERQPGDGPGRRGDHPHLADRRQDEAPARPRSTATGRTTTMSAPSATSPNTPSTPPSPTACRSTSARSRRASSPISCCGRPAFFGVKPDLVIKGGVIAAAPMGDPNASIPTPQPIHYRPMFGAYRPRADGNLADLRLGRGGREGPGAQAEGRQAARRGRRTRARSARRA